MDQGLAVQETGEMQVPPANEEDIEERAEAEQPDRIPSGQGMEPAAEVDPEQQYRASMAAASMVLQERQVFYKTLLLVRDVHEDAELKERISAFPELACSNHTPGFFLNEMLGTGALERSELVDEDGATGADGLDVAGDRSSAEPVSPEPSAQAEAVEGSLPDGAMPSEETPRVLWSLTEVGERVLDALAPARRLDVLYAKDVERDPVFDFVLDFCREPRSRAEVERALKEQGYLGSKKVSASFFLDRLERGGGLEWDKGWVTTREGREYLETVPTC